MGLEEYRDKRDFSATPEPAGGTPSEAKRIFVVQQHHATAMHYDFRLELDGVLLSWAVPKGPSYDPKERRLAVHVEDHPLDYAGFEGVIPKGQYGGGNVIVWDRGTWEPINDPHEGLAKGDFKFRLSGEKLTGGWVLVRLKPRPGEKRDNWLLIKERDEMARPASEFDVTRDEPLSVVSGVRVDEVGTVAPANSPDLALCTLVSSPPAGDGWIGEVKYDGYRVRITVENGEARCFSRNGEDLTGKLGPVARAAAALPASSLLLDGEAVVFDERGVSRFGLLADALGSHPERIVFVAFDLLRRDGADLTGEPTPARKEALRDLLSGLAPDAPIRFAEYVEGGVDALMEAACAQGLEGVVAKRADAPYPSGRTRAWLKVKCRHAQEFVVGGFTDPKGSREGFGALLLGYHDAHGRLVYAGRVGSGFSERRLREIAAALEPIERPEPPFAEPPAKLPGAHWVEPRLVAQVAFSEWTADGLLRQPSFLGLRADADPASVVREAPVAPEPADPPGPADDAPSADGTVAGVRITNPGKRLFPDSDLTKAELARYYEAVAPLMLAEVAERPLTLVRCPVGNGTGSCFYQRHPDRGLPGPIHVLGHMLRGHEEADEWLYVRDAAGLVALAQMGVAEIHTWLSRADEPRRPDRIVFDLDPGPGVEWAHIVHAALVLRDECAALGFTPFVKTTGSKGLHVTLPIEPVWEFTRVHDLARSIAERVAAAHPDDLTPKMSKELRPGRIFVDYVRNSEAASAVAPYSTRHLEGPPVAVPLAWEELDPNDDLRRRFTPERVIERVKAGTDPWRDIDKSPAGVRVLREAEGSLPL